jgi:hypothetical protein
MIRRAALDDLRSDGMSEDALIEIAGLWRREDEILAEARTSAAAQRPTSPIMRLRINHERARLDRIEAPIVKTIMQQLRDECEKLFGDFTKGPRFLSGRRVKGTAEDAAGMPIEVAIYGFIWWKSFPTITIRIGGMDEALVLQSRALLANPHILGAYIRFHPSAGDPTVTRRRAPTLAEAQAYRDIVHALRTSPDIRGFQ